LVKTAKRVLKLNIYINLVFFLSKSSS